MSLIVKLFVKLIILTGLLFLTACSTTPHSVRHTAPNTTAEVYDPLEGLNREVTKFNNGADRYLIKPMTSIYQLVLPKFARKGIHNFSKNLGEPIVFVNEVLQLDFDDASDSLGRFMLNSTVGIGGLVDIAEKQGVPQQNESFGQTLATYGVPEGPYIVLPLLGPSNARDIVGRVGEGFANPVRRLDFDGDQSVQIGRRVSTGLEARVRAEPFLENINNAADPYVNLRSLYNQNQLSNIHEDADPFDSDDGFDEDEDDGFANFD